LCVVDFEELKKKTFLRKFKPKFKLKAAEKEVASTLLLGAGTALHNTGS
jgi:hypothetical protein